MANLTVAEQKAQDIIASMKQGNTDKPIILFTSLEDMDKQVGITGISPKILYSTNSNPYIVVETKAGDRNVLWMSRGVVEEIGADAEDVSLLMDYQIQHEVYNNKVSYKLVRGITADTKRVELTSFASLFAAGKPATN